MTAATVLLGARLRGPAVALPVELAGAFGALVAVALAVTDPPFLALVLGLCGVLAAATALRPERRPVAGYLAAALFVAASWVRLAASGVSAPRRTPCRCPWPRSRSGTCVAAGIRPPPPGRRTAPRFP